VEGLRASARAAVDALMQAVGDQHRSRTQALMGFCVAGTDQHHRHHPHPKGSRKRRVPVLHSAMG